MTGGTDPASRSPRGGRVGAARLLCLLLVAALLGAAVTWWAGRHWTRVEVVSASMSPTLRVGERAWVDTRYAGGRGVAAGDVVVFRDPGGFTDHPGSLVTKRVIALGGQSLSCCDGSGALLRDGRRLDEPYLPAGVVPSGLAFDVTVPAGSLWLMGDNRPASLDSRQAGPVPATAVLGRIRSAGR
ncbi:signal peptidase I [Nocardioides sp.]|uniref:signal peptidase I n=1 Tax=Nocardioides sp. TaxID=35761 RepID=UPI0039E295FC